MKTQTYTPLDGLELPLEHAAEYDAAAEWCARRGISGKPGSQLPSLMNPEGALKYINDDPEAFEMRVKQCYYAQLMEAYGREREMILPAAITLAEAAHSRGDRDNDHDWKLRNALTFNSILPKLI